MARDEEAVGQDTQPMTLGAFDTGDWRDGWPTEEIARPRTGARRSAGWGRVAPWVLLTVLGGAALGGGAWFALTANANLAPAGTATTSASPTGPAPTQGGVIVIPAAPTHPAPPASSAATLRATTPVAHPAPVRAGTTAASTRAHAPTAPSSTRDAPSRSATPPPTGSTTTPAPAKPSPVSTAPDPANTDCVVVTYSDGSTIDVCAPSTSPSVDPPTVGP
jgi:hypothetical protein